MDIQTTCQTPCSPWRRAIDEFDVPWENTIAGRLVFWASDRQDGGLAHFEAWGMSAALCFLFSPGSASG